MSCSINTRTFKLFLCLANASAARRCMSTLLMVPYETYTVEFEIIISK